MKNRPEDVDSYIAAAPAAVRARLRQLRAVIRKAAPRAQERISYGIPFYYYKGRLVYFAAFKSHIGFYVPTPVVAEHARELAKYETSSATVRFPYHRPLPAALVAKLVKARVKKNDAGQGKFVEA